MASMRSVTTGILIGTCLGAIAGCSSALMGAPVSKTADGWSITLSQAKEGPDEYIGEGGILVEPGDGQKMIWAVVSFRNDSAQEQTFAYDTCVLVDKGTAYQPLIVDRHAEINAPVDKAETFAPGQDRVRQLVFPFPNKDKPTLLRCGTIGLPIRAR